MHSQHITIIVVGMILGFIALAYFVRRALQRAETRAHVAARNTWGTYRDKQVAALNTDLTNLTKKHKREKSELVQTLAETQQRLTEQDGLLLQVKSSPLTADDHQTLIAIARTLDLALQTWTPLKGTELVQAKARAQQQKLFQLTARVRDMVESTTLLNRNSLDTQLIEWLDKNGSLWGLELYGHPHIRDALRAAVEQERLATLGETQTGDAA